ncbi:BolA family transcriptional regulator [Buchnera aphidicola (Thelaxes californica)]|uniref:BolA family transcriptional regulator n=1 Tax=Buchnera aphidicola (Thelaxes californica) TaxID=1315998 RepID=A0A4D6YLN8_9GAMM|nr:BolA family protein [Buchnera aphidicola]QCI26884.1 BolA family transcriptional regulator [Buchnera aphidicola (Thelaxes californica)]
MIKKIKETIQKKIKPLYLSIINESSLHKNNLNGIHCKIIIVTNDFINMSLIDRHKIIYKILFTQFSKNIYALNLHTYTSLEWKQKNKTIKKVLCVKNKKK